MYSIVVPGGLQVLGRYRLGRTVQYRSRGHVYCPGYFAPLVCCREYRAEHSLTEKNPAKVACRHGRYGRVARTDRTAGLGPTVHRRWCQPKVPTYADRHSKVPTWCRPPLARADCGPRGSCVFRHAPTGVCRSPNGSIRHSIPKKVDLQSGAGRSRSRRTSCESTIFSCRQFLQRLRTARWKRTKIL
jgi:hypothetical protein